MLSATGLYDTQLYCILSEHKSAGKADKDLTKWMNLSRQNYEILKQEEVVCNGQTYVLLSYNCISEDNPTIAAYPFLASTKMTPFALS